MYHSVRDLLADISQDYAIAAITLNEVIEYPRDPRDS